MSTVVSNFSCTAVWNFTRSTIQHSETSLTMDRILKSPTNLSIELSPVVMEGLHFTVLCRSSGGEPVSQYEYGKIIRLSKTYSCWLVRNRRLGQMQGALNAHPGNVIHPRKERDLLNLVCRKLPKLKLPRP